MSFKKLNIVEPILQALDKKGYTTPSPIQIKAIPLLLEGKDVIGIAQTGTGKTAAFAIPILQKLFEKYGVNKATTPKALILAPTRELVVQISESFETYGKFLNFKHLAVYGGVSIGTQIKNLKYGIDILIATPGRLMDLMNQGKVNLSNIEFLVLDEADRMLDMGFLKDIKKIASALPVERQSLFFSATMSNSIAALTMDFLKNPTRIDIMPEYTLIDKIEQCVFFVDYSQKNELLLDLMKQGRGMDRTLIFVGMKHKADKIVDVLISGGIKAEAIHSNKSQIQRVRALESFRSGKAKVLVATDIAARGIDIKNISHVINYDLPNEPENYIHRIGRTARAGADGIAYSFCCAADRNFLNQIERITKRKTPVAEHKWHSLDAKNAEGKDAKPVPRVQRGEGRPRSRSRNDNRGNVRRSSRGDTRGNGGHGRSRRSGGRERSGRIGGRSRSGNNSGRSRPRR